MKKNKFKVAFRGLYLGFLDAGVQIQWVCMLLAILACVMLQVELFDFILVIIVCTIVLALEYFNTAIEKIMNMIQPERDERVRDIKDMSAASVLIGALGALFVAMYIGMKYFI